MSKINKILVIGASIAGPAICYWLKKFGFSPILIEKNKTLRIGGYAIDVRGIAVNVVKKMDIYKKICHHRTQLKHGYYVDMQGNVLLKEEGEKFGFREDEDVEIVRGDLIEILMQTIKDIPCYFNQTIKQIVQQDESVEVTFSNGSIENFDLIIGCDGLHSSTRRLIFSENEYELIDLGCYISVFTTPNFLNLNKSEMLFESNQKLVSVSNDENPNTSRAAFMFRSRQKLNDIRDENEQKKFLEEAYRDLGWESNRLLQLMEKSDDFYFDAIMQVKMKSWAKGRAVLVGDAGYCASPLSGQGTSLALVGAYILAGELKAANGNYAAAFLRYNTLLHPFVEANQNLGAWASETFLLPEDASMEAVTRRADYVLEKLHAAANAIDLPEYV